MLEMVPIGLGVGIGLLLTRSTPGSRVRWFALPCLCLTLGALATWLTGEAATGLWPLFVSLDAMIVWMGAVGVMAVTATHRRATEGLHDGPG